MPARRSYFGTALVVAWLTLALAGCRKPGERVVIIRMTPPPVVTPIPPPTPPPAPTPPPPPYVPAKRLELGKIFNGLQYRVTLETERGGTATAERNDPESYVADLTVKVKVPKAHRSLEELSKLNAQLPTLLPALPAMLETAKVAETFEDLYRRKCAQLRASINRLDAVLSRHNFFDCETILELQHPQTKRRAVLIQGDMDTDMDGSDPDRVPEIDGSSATFQPMTSYRWPRKGSLLNSFIPPLEAKVKLYDQELALPTTSAARKAQLNDERSDARAQIADLKASSFLVARTDPFIVLPTPMVTKSGSFAPLIGDYCVVIHGSTLYPAIVGDAGPTTKVGEASLRLCKQIEPKASAEQRAENNLKVTYLVFPGSRVRPFAPPDLEKWRARCETLLAEVGGYGGTLFKWEDLAKPPPATPPPVPPVSPTPSATPAPESKPTASQ